MLDPSFFGGESSLLIDNKYLSEDEFEQLITLYDIDGDEILSFNSADMYDDPASDWVYASLVTNKIPQKITGVIKHENREYLDAIKNAESENSWYNKIYYGEVKQDENGKWYLEWSNSN